MIADPKHAADGVAGVVSVFALISQWASIVQPIVGTIAAILSISWFIYRWYGAWRGRKTED